ncbi:hypothetical protein G7067_05345 [Leucobacter insecticola]|uniref:Uncharacterized protein n=1 Tax=Leucobacter insecticola TaxID=2714934 RepID=A0A6G8FI51_9MICO|nr:hypothetical protein [Leucobacter insecticola]QIM15973.1 hypothetical protein G7067_05345 [Leucobacter insecticola]
MNEQMSEQSSEQRSAQQRASWPIRALVAVAEKVPHSTPARRVILSLVAVLAAAGAVLLGISGLTLSEGLAPVSGDRASTVRIATIDFLVADGTVFLEVPECVADDDSTVACLGETVDGEPVKSQSAGADPESVEISVADRVVYSGLIEDVLSEAADGGKAGAP